ncbi:hypothetical protein VUR80DRAFT_35 [Thermomyces stellatus]
MDHARPLVHVCRPFRKQIVGSSLILLRGVIGGLQSRPRHIRLAAKSPLDSHHAIDDCSASGGSSRRTKTNGLALCSIACRRPCKANDEIWIALSPDAGGSLPLEQDFMLLKLAANSHNILLIWPCRAASMLMNLWRHRRGVELAERWCVMTSNNIC